MKARTSTVLDLNVNMQKANPDAKIDGIITKLLDLSDKPIGQSVSITPNEVMTLCKCASEILKRQPMLLNLRPPVYICGDTHGQFHDVLRIFACLGYPPKANYLFLGDYVDRGQQSVENISLLLAYKIKYPESFFLLRGNHECEWINKLYGFFSELKDKGLERVYASFTQVFQCMPVAAIVGDKLFCVHGGLSPNLESLDQITAMTPPLEVPREGLLCDLLWSDPNEEIGADKYVEGSRGLGWKYSSDAVKEFLDTFGFDMLVRAHQPPSNGFQFLFSSGSEVSVTIFSVPRYGYVQDNKGAVMYVDEELSVKFYQFEAVDWDWEPGLKKGPRPTAAAAQYGY